MKILILTGFLSYRGTGIYTLNLSEELKARGHSVRIICTGGNLVNELIKKKIPVDVYPGLLNPIENLFLFSRVLRKINADIPDIIHTHQPRLAGFTSRLAQKLKKPYFLTIPHAQQIRSRIKINDKWIKNIIVTTESGREHLVNEIGAPKDLIEVIYVGVSSELLKSISVPKDEGLKSVIGIIGPLEEWRGHHDFILAAQDVIAKGFEPQFLIIGEGMMESDLRHLVMTLGIQKHVVFIPSLDSYHKILTTVDIFVFPIRQIGMGLTILEAMGLGKPVIVSAIGDVYKLVKDGETGWLIPPQNYQAVAEKIVFALNNKMLALEIGERARKFVEANFSSQQMTDKTIELYQKALTA